MADPQTDSTATLIIFIDSDEWLICVKLRKITVSSGFVVGFACDNLTRVDVIDLAMTKIAMSSFEVGELNF